MTTFFIQKKPSNCEGKQKYGNPEKSFFNFVIYTKSMNKTEVASLRTLTFHLLFFRTTPRETIQTFVVIGRAYNLREQFYSLPDGFLFFLYHRGIV